MLLTSRKITFENLSTATSVSTCLLMASIYVGSLYLWRHENRYRRNEPSVIKRRFVSVILSCFLSLLLLNFLGESGSPQAQYTLAEWIGVRFYYPWEMIKSSLVALFLTAVLFLGPLVQLFVTQTDYNNNKQACFFKKLSNPISFACEMFRDCLTRLQDPCFLRNYLISPFTEEFVFRSCMLPLVTPKLFSQTAILTTPLFFGVAHLHHIVEGLKTNSASLTQLVSQHLFQFAYTYIFGVYSSYLFVRTGCFFPTFISHSFCNFLGFPHIDELLTSSGLKTSKRIVIILCYIGGVVLFFNILNPFTDPTLFNNTLYSAFKK